MRNARSPTTRSRRCRRHPWPRRRLTDGPTASTGTLTPAPDAPRSARRGGLGRHARIGQPAFVPADASFGLQVRAIGSFLARLRRFRRLRHSWPARRRTRTRSDRHATLLRRDAALGAPNGAHIRANPAHRADTPALVQRRDPHRSNRRALVTTEAGSTRQKPCAEVLVARHAGRLARRVSIGLQS